MTEAPPSAKGFLSLICSKCRTVGRFTAENRAVASIKAQQAGWTFHIEGRETCPKCPVGKRQ